MNFVTKILNLQKEYDEKIIIIIGRVHSQQLKKHLYLFIQVSLTRSPR